MGSRPVTKYITGNLPVSIQASRTGEPSIILNLWVDLPLRVSSHSCTSLWATVDIASLFIYTTSGNHHVFIP